MQEAREAAEERLAYLERGLDWKLNGDVKEEFLRIYTEFIYETDKDLPPSVLLPDMTLSPLIFRATKLFREKVRQLIGQEKMFSLLGTDEELRGIEEKYQKMKEAGEL